MGTGKREGEMVEGRRFKRNRHRKKRRADIGYRLGDERNRRMKEGDREVRERRKGAG
jgi:hypothetical protein